MQWFDPRIRCNRCGYPFADTGLKQCPSCQADLAEVGTTSEVEEWGRTRLRGRSRYIWVRSVLLWGGLLAVTSCGALAIVRGSTDPVSYLLASVPWLIGGYVLGHVTWRVSEREYESLTARRARPRSSEQ